MRNFLLLRRAFVNGLRSFILLLLVCGVAVAKGSPQPAPDVDLPLPELPKAPNIGVREATPLQIERLNELLSRLTAPDALMRENATAEILEVTPEWVPAIARMVNKLADRGSHEDMKKVLTEARSKARSAAISEMKERRERGTPKAPDYLQMLQQFPRLDSAPWKATVTVLALSRMLAQIGTVEAARTLVNVYVRFGDFLRVDTQLQLDKLGDVAVAALIETERHPAPKISNWAKRQLDLRHRAIPSDAVRGADENALPEILRAYGRTKNPDAARIVVSFTNSERGQLRLAARQSLALMGPTALWQLRDTYEDVVGRTAPRDWSWERMARELFREFDRLHLARVHQLFRDGLGLLARGQLAEMAKKFDEVLTRSPQFEGADQIAAGYLTFAEAAKPQEVSQALLAAERAERIATQPELKARAKSARLALEARQLLARGIADASLLEGSLDADAKSPIAQALKPEFEAAVGATEDARARYAGALAIAFAALAALGTILFRRPKTAPPGP
ncbi:MAG: hypothetical protein SFV15_22500 [Polyangiaceae bacterium]|nr:hypothetical protein [Polyangiaceae bacterium]